MRLRDEVRRQRQQGPGIGDAVAESARKASDAMAKGVSRLKQGWGAMMEERRRAYEERRKQAEIDAAALADVERIKQRQAAR